MATTIALTQANIFVSTATTPSPSSKPMHRIRGYKDFLTPALHRRFTKAAAAVLFFCLVESWFLADSTHIFWSWFPLGRAGVRALLLSISCLAVFIVRVANMHIGDRMATSTAAGLYARLTGTKLVVALTWYVFGAWWFGEVYIWSKSETAALALLDQGTVYERARVSENPIFLRCLLLVVGATQAVLHLVRDYDRVVIPINDEQDVHKKSWVAECVGDVTLSKLPDPLRTLLERSGEIFLHSANATIYALFLALFLYFGVIRNIVWTWAYTVVRTWFRQLSAEGARPSGISHFWKFSWQAFSASFTLLLLFEISTIAFGALASQPPLKRDEPLTSEIKDGQGVILHTSSDPNGSLLAGLRSKKEVTRGFAFWELYLICDGFSDRRQTIYSEVDRRNGNSTWSKICEYALKEVEAIQERIVALDRRPESKNQREESATQQISSQSIVTYDADTNTGLRRIADQGVRDNQHLFVKRKSDLINTVGDLAKSIGQTSNAADPVSPRARKAIQWGANRLLSPEEQQRFTAGNIRHEASSYFASLLGSPIGEPFRQIFALQVLSTIFGNPYDRRATISHAVRSLSKLCVASLKEDKYGSVQRDVAKIIRSLTTTIQAIERFVRELAPSWTDVTFSEQARAALYDPWALQALQNPPLLPDSTSKHENDKALAERLSSFSKEARAFTEFMEILKSGLEDILLTFDEYTSTLGLSLKEVREAKEAIQRPLAPGRKQKEDVERVATLHSRPEMEQVGVRPSTNASRQRRVYN